eukprot:TRINITY_DN2564_c0_g1_i4.p1 TRINITY_DN2564_c0_g1~~TRINITY_DN2564_c0_g1_i4.p1  ORF type:complete len:629 (-),score=105.35 TRINITY_DN2564_c0_g1_i4:1706-3592(-)
MLSKLYLVTDRIGLTPASGEIVCFGDVNNDRYTDLFLLVNSSYLTVYLWEHANYSFAPSMAYIVDDNITTAAAGDFNYDGMLDVLVTGSSGGIPYLHLYIAQNSSNPTAQNIYTQAPLSLTPGALDQPLVLDANGDLKLDVLAISYETQQRVFWINDGTGQSFSQFNLTSTLPPSLVNSNAFADMDGDCKADLIISTLDQNGLPVVQIYINSPADPTLNFITPTMTLPSQAGMGQLTIADFDGDGTNDLLFPVYSTNTIHVVYNIQMPLCSSSLFNENNNGACRDPTSSAGLCVADPQFSISSLTATTNQQNHVVIPLSGVNAHLAPQTATVPLTVRYGDYNFDGYPDLLVPVVTSGGAYMVQLWENIPCTEDLCGNDATEANHRTFQFVNDDTTSALGNITNAYAATFIDLDEDGSLDILVLVDSALNGTKPGHKTIAALYNNIYVDAYFLKTLGLNGVCVSWCEGGVSFPDPKPYGVNYPGGTFKFVVTDLVGTPRSAIGSQLTQSSYLALQTPYILFGLGRTNNYIDELFYGTTYQIDTTTSYATFIGVIPNSQIVIVPEPAAVPSEWQIELYINPSVFTLWVIVAVLATLVLLFGAIMFFRRREKIEDENEKKEMAHLFSFGAL